MTRLRTIQLETQIEYILKCAKKIQQEDIKAMEVQREAVMELYKYIESWHKKSVFDAACKR